MGDGGEDSGPVGDWPEGCHVVDGERGFLWVVDALEYAQEGAVISLCEGELTEELVVTRSVSLQGPGVDALTWRGAGGPPLTVTGGAEVSLSGLRVESVSDGVVVEAGGLVVDGVAFSVDARGVVGSGAEVTLRDCTWTGGTHGVVTEGGSLQVSGGALEDTVAAGIVALGADSVAIADTAIGGDQDLLLRTDDPEAWPDEAGAVVITSDGSVSLEMVSISDHHARGLSVSGIAGSPEVRLSEVTVSDVGRLGVVLREVDAEASDLEITGLRLVDDPELVNQGFEVTVGVGLRVEGGGLEWRGGALVGSELVGMYATDAQVQVEGVTVDDNASFGLWTEGGTLEVSGSTFTAGSPSGSVYAGSGAVALTGNTFTDNREGDSFEVDDDGSVLVYETSNFSLDIAATAVESLVISDNTFSSGSFGISLLASEGVRIEGNTWTDYLRHLLYLYGVDDPVQLDDNLIVDSAGYMIHCFYSALEADELVVQGQVETRYEDAYYRDGEYVDGGIATIWEPAVHGTSCALELRHSSFTETGKHPVELVDSALVIEELSIEGGSKHADASDGVVQARYLTTPADVDIRGLLVDGHDRGAGLRLVDETGEVGSVTLSDVEILDSGGEGIVLDGILGAQASGITVEGTWDAALRASGSLSLEDATLTGSKGHGLEWLGGDLSLTDAVVSGHSRDGLALSGEAGDTVVVEACTVTGNGRSGISADGLVLELRDSQVTGNDGVGLSCDGAEVATCEGVDLSGNTLGESEGCDLSCD